MWHIRRLDTNVTGPFLLECDSTENQIMAIVYDDSTGEERTLTACLDVDQNKICEFLAALEVSLGSNNTDWHASCNP